MEDDLLYIPDVIPIFPLPGVVLFPHMLVPMHIYEPRYREMVADTLIGARVFAIALLKPGWEPLYETPRAPIYKTVGVGQIMETQQLDDGNYNLLLRGLGRATIIGEQTDRSYRQAQVELVQTFCSADEKKAGTLRSRLFSAIRNNPALEPELRKNWLKLKKADLDLDALADLVAAGTPVEAELRQCLLEEPDAVARADLLISQLQTLEAVTRTHLRIPEPDEYHFN
jgi:Lon protease-like protein